jgi:hypothetical protein
MLELSLHHLHSSTRSCRIASGNYSNVPEGDFGVKEASQLTVIEPLSVNVDTAAKMTSLSPHTIRHYIKTNRLNVNRVGRRIVIPMESLKELIANGAPSRTAPPDIATSKEHKNQ